MDRSGETRGGSVELAEIFAARGASYRARHALTREQYAAMRAIESCRTARLGGHLLTCDRCGESVPLYNSCRDRHCPKCQTLAKQRWLLARQKELLPIDYFHLVFTLPHDLHAIARQNPRWVYNTLFGVVGPTLLDFGADERWLGGQIGVTAILHSWGQTLALHPHIHAIVTGGALSTDRSRWIAARRSFLFPVHALAKTLRGRFLDRLRRALDDDELTVPQHLDASALLDALYAKGWVVYAKRPFAGPQALLDYLGRYTHRVGLSNDRLVDFDGQTVRLRFKDYRDGGRVKILSLDADELIRRFLLHVLPRGFTRIRHFGLLASRNKTSKIARCRKVLGAPAPEASPETLTARELMLRVQDVDIDRCPVCGTGKLQPTAVLPRSPFATPSTRAPPARTAA